MDIAVEFIGLNILCILKIKHFDFACNYHFKYFICSILLLHSLKINLMGQRVLCLSLLNWFINREKNWVV